MASCGDGNSSAEQCYDCGPCGMTAPAYQDHIALLPAGAVAGGVAVLPMMLTLEGQCGGEGSIQYLTFDSGVVHVTETEPPGFDRTLAEESDAGEQVTVRYDWTDRELSLSGLREDWGWTLTFFKFGPPAEVTCQIGSGKIECGIL